MWRHKYEELLSSRMLESLALKHSWYHTTGQLFSNQKINMKFPRSPSKQDTTFSKNNCEKRLNE